MVTTHSLGSRGERLRRCPPSLGTGVPLSVPLIVPTTEDGAILTLLDAGSIITERMDSLTRRSSDLLPDHLGAIRLYERGLLRLVSEDEGHQRWTWTSEHAESDGLRILQQRRTLGFLPFNLGARGLLPEDMSEAQLVALLAWHLRSTPIRYLDIRVTPTGRIAAEAFSDRSHGEPSGSETKQTDWNYPPVVRVDEFGAHTRRAHPHLDLPERRFEDVVVASLFTHLASRVGPARFGEAAATVDLNTWRVHSYGRRAESFEEWLPTGVTDALLTLGAPLFLNPEALTRWATAALQVTVLCRGAEENRLRRGGHRHTICLNPLDGSVSSVPTKDERARAAVEAHHLLEALTGDVAVMRCQLVMAAWATDGHVTLDGTFASMQRDRILAAHRVATAVQSLH